MFIAEKATPTNNGLSRDTRVDSDNAEKMRAAIERVFQEHETKLGSKTLMSIAYCMAGVQR